MKARIKETGEIVEVEDLYDDGTALVKGTYFKVSQLDFFSDFETTDWEQRRYEISKDVLSAFLSNSNEMIFEGNPEDHAKDAVVFADALIKRLKGE